MNNECKEVESNNHRKSIREMSAMSQIYRLMLRSGLSIEEISGRLTAMRKLHNETPNAKVNVLFLTQLSMNIMDKKSKEEFDNRYNKISQEIYRKEGIKDLMKALNYDDIEHKDEHTE